MRFEEARIASRLGHLISSYLDQNNLGICVGADGMMRIAPGYTAFAALPALCVKTSRQFAMRSRKPGAMARPKVRLTDSRHSNDPCMAAPVPLCCALE